MNIINGIWGGGLTPCVSMCTAWYGMRQQVLARIENCVTLYAELLKN